MLPPIIALSAIVAGLLLVTAWAFYYQGQRVARSQNLRLKAELQQVAAQLESETERANKSFLKLEKLKREKLFVHGALGRLERFDLDHLETN